MATLDDAARDAFFGELYEATTAPLLTEAMTRAEVRSFVSLLQPAAGARVLDLGCGWGRHLPLLAEAGLAPIGLDRSATYVRRARAETGHPIVRADVRALPFGSGALDAVACFYASLFFFDDAGNLSVLGELARILRPGGALVLQAANPVHLRRLGTEDRSLALPGGRRVHEHTFFDVESGREEGTRRLTRPDGAVVEGRYSIRHYAPGELEVLARRAGLVPERIAGDLSLAPYTRESRDVVALLRKPERITR